MNLWFLSFHKKGTAGVGGMSPQRETFELDKSRNWGRMFPKQLFIHREMFSLFLLKHKEAPFSGASFLTFFKSFTFIDINTAIFLIG